MTGAAAPVVPNTSGETTSTPKWNVYKFGGTSVATAQCYQGVVKIVTEAMQKDPKMAVVVSAMGGKPKVTDLLIDTVNQAAEGEVAAYEETLAMVREKHINCVSELFKKELCETFARIMDQDLTEIRDVLRAVTLMKYKGEKIVELVSGYGEIWSAQILTYLFKESGKDFYYINARKVLFVNEDADTGPEIMWDYSKEKLTAFMARHPHANPVITGFVASTADGVATTLKRDGSDYSASIFGRLLEASGITIWTDVDGVLSADPRRVPEAKVLSNVSYNEAMELAYFGAKVIHPKTMTPAVAASIPIFIRNTFNPTFPGTRIFVSSETTINREMCVCGFSTIDNMALLNLEGSGMMGVPGIAHRLFGAIQRAGISVTLIAQASSEHSISFATKAANAHDAKKAVEDEFFRERQSGVMAQVDLISPCSIIAAVGDGMSNESGVAGKFFKALGSAHVNILAISQGSSERNISAVVRGTDSTKSLRAVHSAFLLSNQVISVGVVGAGKVARALMEVLSNQAMMLKSRFGTEFQIRGIMNSTHMLLTETTQDPLNLLEKFNKSKTKVNLEAFTSHIRADHLPHAIIIDVSSASEIALHHAHWLQLGVHVVTANKKGLAGDLATYNAILRQRKIMKSIYMYEVTVGGGLRVLATLQCLLNGGDHVTRLEGALSASLNYVMSAISPAPKEGRQPLPFSAAVDEAIRTGVMERDPIDDLVGLESAQKILVLAREMSYPITVDDVEAEALVPRDADLNNLAQFDEMFAKRAAEALSRGCVLRYISVVDQYGGAKSGIQEVPFDHEFASLKGACYCFRLFSEFHSVEPITIQGALGIPQATASSLFSDLLFVAQRVGAKDKGPTSAGAAYSDSRMSDA